MLLQSLASGDYAVRVTAWTDTGQTCILYFAIHNRLVMFLQNGFPGLALVVLSSMPKNVFLTGYGDLRLTKNSIWIQFW